MTDSGSDTYIANNFFSGNNALVIGDPNLGHLRQSIPVMCSSCKIPFEDTSVAIYGNARISSSRNSTVCPNCNALAQYKDGQYDFVTQTASAFRENPPTKKQIRRFKDKVLTETDKDAAVLKAKSIGETFALAVEQAKAFGNFGKALKIIMGIAAAVYISSQTVKGTAEGLIEADRVWDMFQAGELLWQEPEGNLSHTNNVQQEAQTKTEKEKKRADRKKRK